MEFIIYVLHTLITGIDDVYNDEVSHPLNLFFPILLIIWLYIFFVWCRRMRKVQTLKDWAVNLLTQKDTMPKRIPWRLKFRTLQSLGIVLEDFKSAQYYLKMLRLLLRIQIFWILHSRFPCISVVLTIGNLSDSDHLNDVIYIVYMIFFLVPNDSIAFLNLRETIARIYNRMG